MTGVSTAVHEGVAAVGRVEPVELAAQPGPAVSVVDGCRMMVVKVALLYSKDAEMASSSCNALRLVAVRPHMTVVTVTTGPSKQEVEGGGGGETGGRGGALTTAPNTFGFRPAGVGRGVEPGGLMGPGPGAGTATTVTEGLVDVIGAGAATGDRAAEELLGDGADAGGCMGAGAGVGGAVHDLEGPVGSLQVSVHCDDLTRLTVEACTKF